MSEEKQEEVPAACEEELFDLLIPPGVPQSIIFELIKKYGLEVVKRKQKLYFANMDGDERELLAFRGRRDVLVEAEILLKQRLAEFIGDDSAPSS
ncbi:MAG: hypothetical protein NT074_08645 [Methanomicrobiales archaeon]|jgi:hypothetical protein|nr:hypothetical protein [Methanomicrobiales archaeon]